MMPPLISISPKCMMVITYRSPPSEAIRELPRRTKSRYEDFGRYIISLIIYGAFRLIDIILSRSGTRESPSRFTLATVDDAEFIYSTYRNSHANTSIV